LTETRLCGKIENNHRESNMRQKLLPILLFPVLITANIFANPQDTLAECYSYFTKNETALINTGAKCIAEIDLRYIGLILMRHYLLEKDEKTYIFITHDGQVNSVEIREQYTSTSKKEKFEEDAESARQLVYGLGGWVDSVSGSYFIKNNAPKDARVIRYKALMSNVFDVYIVVDSDYYPDTGWAGKITVQVSREDIK